MYPVAILGATSQIAQDFIRGHDAHVPLILFSRRPKEVARWLREAGLATFSSLGYEEFPRGRYGAIVNFVGSGDPARTADLGGSILEITSRYDDLALDYLRAHPRTRYVFFSSGAAYGNTFLQPAGPETLATIPLNSLSGPDYYGIAKLHAEARHRAMSEHAIVDVRIFSYFSRHTPLSSRFFVADILRAIRDRVELETDANTMRRDIIGPPDFCSLTNSILSGTERNIAIDTYSKAPVEKFSLLEAMREAFGLRYRVVESPRIIRSTGAKPEYYSTNRMAASFGYAPTLTSLEGVMQESRAVLLQFRS